MRPGRCDPFESLCETLCASAANRLSERDGAHQWEAATPPGGLQPGKSAVAHAPSIPTWESENYELRDHGPISRRSAVDQALSVPTWESENSVGSNLGK